MTTAVKDGERRADDERDDRPLRRGEWRTLAILRLPTLALALAITAVTTYLPVVASGFAASTVIIGVLIGGDGLIALGLPVLSARGPTASGPASAAACRSCSAPRRRSSRRSPSSAS